MEAIGRRRFVAAGLAASALKRLHGAEAQAHLDEALRSGIARRKIPAAVAMVANGKRTLYSGAFGVRDSSGVRVRTDSIFSIASMTKAITTVAALQLVEAGRVALDEPVAKHLPQFENVQVLEGFDAGGKPTLRAPKTAPTLRHLLTHTSGLCYDVWDADMFRYASQHRGSPEIPGPLMFQPGTRWQYGQGLDWAGRLVEAVTGSTLEDYFQEKIFRRLEMPDTSFILTETKFDRLVSSYHRTASGDLEQDPRKMPARPKSFNGGGGLYSTAADYVRFMQAILNRGVGANGARILREDTVAKMATNQIGSLSAGKMKSFEPQVSGDVDIQPGETESWGLGFLINTTAYPGGRSAGSLAWAVLFNTFYWIDPKGNLCAVLLMQFLPFVDKEAVGLLGDFETAVYRAGLG